MNDMLKRIVNRFKKWWIVLLIIPLLTGAIGYFLAKGETETYTAKSEITLGNFSDRSITSSDLMAGRLSQEGFLQNLSNETGIQLDVDYLAENTAISTGAGRKIILTFTGTNLEKVKREAENLIKAFIQYSDEKYNGQREVLIEQINKLQQFSDEEDPNKYMNTWKMSDELENLTPTYLNKEVTVTTNSSSPVTNLLLGLVVGLFISLCIPFIPEFFIRNEE
ncbi:hypothetical protein A8F94_10735 [Bacillus sp. FJAT-27225]|uniref:hypothetical protein n=1 Tax=Bacillus sp. FJAT-27225 TaxID=1743144 RepID=UPI00080C2686|nr:hypothetical protein [Bacillus sp. FJAT-27225]OCA88267.1 hypothetical protein A8F94_10735 [Bacillus sp. FJAT-27225]